MELVKNDQIIVAGGCSHPTDQYARNFVYWDREFICVSSSNRSQRD
ncbi:MAG: hypothetical protein ABWZ75_11030 [Novosphingobium sp.]